MTWRQRALAAERQVKRLKRIEHAAWHLLDNSEEKDRNVTIGWEDYIALSKLLPEDHP